MLPEPDCREVGSPNPLVIKWPSPVTEHALIGVAGEVVRVLAPHTEADPHAILIQFLTGFGNLVGPGPHFCVEADRHRANLFVVLVGVSAKGRKGTSWGQTKAILELADEDWVRNNLTSGLSSGEGLIWTVRDPIQPRDEPTGGMGRRGSPVSDAGVQDKRLLVIESEFAAPLSMMRREGNTLSAILRLAWDSGDLRVLTKSSPAVATGAHISIVGHITKAELLKHLNETETANGFANRFLWCCARRSKALPDGGSLRQSEILRLADLLRPIVAFARSVDRVERDAEAAELWRAEYADLSEGRFGLYGAITSRAEAQVMRLALIYALLDGSPQIKVEHLRAGLALWEYSAASCRFIFGSALGDPVADAVLDALKNSPAGMTRSEIGTHFARHLKARELDRALAILASNGLARPVMEATAGRPAERWFLGVGL